MIRSGCHLAETQQEKDAVYRFRYEIYVAEMGRYGEAADHERKMLVEPEDETARIYYAAIDGEVVATSRFSWGGDAPFTQHLIDKRFAINRKLIRHFPDNLQIYFDQSNSAPQLE